MKSGLGRPDGTNRRNGKGVSLSTDPFSISLVRPERFELPTFWFVARRSIQLSYGRVMNVLAEREGFEPSKGF